MSSTILTSSGRFLTLLLAVASVFMLLRGHNEPGGGFIGGLLLAAAFGFHGLAHGAEAARTLLAVEPRTLAGLGLLIAVGSGLVGLLAGDPFLTGHWLAWPIPGVGKVGTVILFDLGVYLVVVGTTLGILFDLAEER